VFLVSCLPVVLLLSLVGKSTENRTEMSNPNSSSAELDVSNAAPEAPPKRFGWSRKRVESVSAPSGLVPLPDTPAAGPADDVRRLSVASADRHLAQ